MSRLGSVVALAMLAVSTQAAKSCRRLRNRERAARVDLLLHPGRADLRRPDHGRLQRRRAPATRTA